MPEFRTRHMVKQGLTGNGTADQGAQRGVAGALLEMIENPAWEYLFEYDQQQLILLAERMKETQK